jgi:AraC-like DNA-binding protein
MAVSEYRETAPAAGLARYLACRWTRQVQPAADRYVQRVVPDGCIDLIWADGVLQVAGPDTGPVLAQVAPGTGLAAVRFRPGRAPAVLGLPASELRDQRVDLAEIWGAQPTERLIERLHAASGPAAAAELLERLVASRLGPEEEPDRLVEGLVGALRVTPPLRVRGLADTLGVSERQLHRRCVDAVGYSPKILDRVLRLQRFLKLAGASASPHLGRLAAAAGYADQAHLSRECRRLTGVTPGQMLGRAT